MAKETQIRVLLVEDEFITRDSLREALEDMDYQISGEAMRAEQAIAILEKGETDIAILDIHLKGELTGIWVGQQIQRQYGIPFIYLTAFGDKGTITEASETRPAAYLAKPFSPTNIYAAIELALQNHQQERAEAAPHVSLDDSIFVKKELTYHRIRLGEILFFQSFRNYLEISTATDKYSIRTSLSGFMEKLPEGRFCQVHKSYVVQLSEVTEIGGNFVRINSHEIPLSRSLKPELLRLVELYK
ncbi:DNA-binding response regulator [Lewinellaceae bacterium SD302]|nr:DNA-binding response regulator [Lewinellaceae bacterium SD302]